MLQPLAFEPDIELINASRTSGAQAMRTPDAWFMGWFIVYPILCPSI